MDRVKLTYKCGYPTVINPVKVEVIKVDNNIIFLNGFSHKEEFRISKDNILKLQYRIDKTNNLFPDVIVLKINYEGSQIEILFSGGLSPEKNYSKLSALIYSSDDNPTRDLVHPALKSNNNFDSFEDIKNKILESKFYNENWFIILALIFFAPIGIYLMYKNKKTDAFLRVLATVMFSIVFLVEIVICASKISNSGNSVETTQNTTKQQSQKVDSANLQTDLRDKLKDNAIQVEDSTDSTGYILIKNKCQADTRGRISYETYLMLNEARKRPEYKKCNKIGVMITADLTDKYGNNSNDKIYMQDFDKSELDKVNWDNIDESKMDTIGETPWYHQIIKLDK